MIAVLYCVDEMVSNLKSCTEQLCQWSRPKKLEVKPKRVVDINVRKAEHQTTGAASREVMRQEMYHQFEPRVSTTRDAKDIDSLFARIKLNNPDAAVLPLVMKPPSLTVEPFLNIVKHSQAILLDSPDVVGRQKKMELILMRTHLSEEQRNLIEKATQEQSGCLAWKQARLGRLTGSNHHKIHQAISKTYRSSAVNPRFTKLVDEVMNGRQDISNIPAVKHGRVTESAAAKAFFQHVHLNHKNFRMHASGLRIEHSRSWIGSSPDRMCVCDCHGIAAVEIKCPFQCPALKNLQYLMMKDGKLQLSESHEYYTQIQSEMGVTQSARGYFVVYTELRLFVQEIPFNQDFYDKITRSLDVFFKNNILPILAGAEELRFCGDCNKICVTDDEITSQQDKCLQCNLCKIWYHLGCVDASLQDTDSWICIVCCSALA